MTTSAEQSVVKVGMGFATQSTSFSLIACTTSECLMMIPKQHLVLLSEKHMMGTCMDGMRERNFVFFFQFGKFLAIFTQKMGPNEEFSYTCISETWAEKQRNHTFLTTASIKYFKRTWKNHLQTALEQKDLKCFPQECFFIICQQLDIRQLRCT